MTAVDMQPLVLRSAALLLARRTKNTTVVRTTCGVEFEVLDPPSAIYRRLSGKPPAGLATHGRSNDGAA